MTADLIDKPGETFHPLTLQLLEWINNKPRSYAEVLDAWRTSCPRLSIWEDACIAGLVACSRVGEATHVSVSAKGTALLWAQRCGPRGQEDPAMSRD